MLWPGGSPATPGRAGRTNPHSGLPPRKRLVQRYDSAVSDVRRWPGNGPANAERHPPKRSHVRRRELHIGPAISARVRRESRGGKRGAWARAAQACREQIQGNLIRSRNGVAQGVDLVRVDVRSVRMGIDNHSSALCPADPAQLQALGVVGAIGGGGAYNGGPHDRCCCENEHVSHAASLV